MKDKKINKLIEEWHKGHDPLPLHKFLGMTIEEYNDWVVSNILPKGTKNGQKINKATK